jgi:hypothetical protein
MFASSSTSADPQHQAGPTFTNERAYLADRVVRDIAPSLSGRPQDQEMAEKMAWRMVRSYAPTSEAQVLGAARAISLSLVQLDLLRESTNRDLTPAMKLRFINAAVSVGREVRGTEQALERRQRSDEFKPAKDVTPESEPVENEAELLAAVQAMAEEQFRLSMRQNLEEAAREVARYESDPEEDVPAPEPDESAAEPAPAAGSAPHPQAVGWDGRGSLLAYMQRMQAAAQENAASEEATNPVVRKAGAGSVPDVRKAAGPG